MSTTVRHHPIVRITHWVNAIALTIMIGSGLQIFNAYPAFARKGETFCCYPFSGRIPKMFTFGGWLAGARNWHFAMMWVLVVNGLVYLIFIDRKSTRLNSSHSQISYAVFCLKKKNK